MGGKDGQQNNARSDSSAGGDGIQKEKESLKSDKQKPPKKDTNNNNNKKDRSQIISRDNNNNNINKSDISKVEKRMRQTDPDSDSKEKKKRKLEDQLEDNKNVINSEEDEKRETNNHLQFKESTLEIIKEVEIKENVLELISSNILFSQVLNKVCDEPTFEEIDDEEDKTAVKELNLVSKKLLEQFTQRVQKFKTDFPFTTSDSIKQKLAENNLSKFRSFIDDTRQSFKKDTERAIIYYGLISDVYNDFAIGLLHPNFDVANLTQESFRAQYFSTLYDKIGHFGEVQTQKEVKNEARMLRKNLENSTEKQSSKIGQIHRSDCVWQLTNPSEFFGIKTSSKFKENYFNIFLIEELGTNEQNIDKDLLKAARDCIDSIYHLGLIFDSYLIANNIRSRKILSDDFTLYFATTCGLYIKVYAITFHKKDHPFILTLLGEYNLLKPKGNSEDFVDLPYVFLAIRELGLEMFGEQRKFIQLLKQEQKTDQEIQFGQLISQKNLPNRTKSTPRKSKRPKKNINEITDYDVDQSNLRNFHRKKVLLIKAINRLNNGEVMIKLNKRKDRAIREFSVLFKLKSLNSPFIPPILDTFEYKNAFAIVTPLYNSSLSISMFYNCLEIEIIRSWSRQLLTGLEEIHKVGILHLDIKPSNLLLRFDENSDHGQIVIIDYDMCRFTHDRDSSFNGTPGWIAPEVWNEEREFEEKSDLYSAALVILCWLSKIIKKQKNIPNDQQKIISKIFQIFHRRGGINDMNNYHDGSHFDYLYSNILKYRDLLHLSSPSSQLFQAIDFLENILKTDPFDRLDISTALLHPFIPYSPKEG